jgi:formiminoglutamase
VPDASLPKDPLWPRASEWLAATSPADCAECDLALVGIPAHRSSITPTGAHATPAAIRLALQRYSTYAASRGLDVSELAAVDLGEISDPDGPEGEARVEVAVAALVARSKLVVALGGDNSITYAAMSGMAGGASAPGRLAGCGLITVDAHHDLRDGVSNGSPVRRLVEAGLPGDNIVQIGIADFSNSPAYAARASKFGITVIDRGELRAHSAVEIAARALAIAGAGGRPVYVDLDVDVCDRAEVPGCPSAAPGGISADELRQLAFLLARSPLVRVVDITEIDAARDARDERTVRLGALLVLEAAAGLLAREF